MYSFKVLSLLVLVGAVAAQYNYKEPPKNTYLPPKHETEKGTKADAITPAAEHEPGMPFDFNYSVKENEAGIIDHNHQAKSDGDVVKGEYRTLLPDGRTQIVRYTADWKNGYNAEVIYEGEAVYPEPAPTRPPAQRPTPPSRSTADIGAGGIQPPSRGYPKQPPPPPRRQPPPPAPPGNLYGTPSQGFGVRNNPKFGLNK